MSKKRTSKQPSLTLHELLVALSFWGTAVRTLLFGFIGAVTYVVALSETVTAGQSAHETLMFIYVLGSFLLLDFGYVMVTRAYRLRRLIDIPVLLVAEALVTVLYVAQKLVVSSGLELRNEPMLYVLFIPLVVLSLRMLIGLLFTQPKR